MNDNLEESNNSCLYEMKTIKYFLPLGLIYIIRKIRSFNVERKMIRNRNELINKYLNSNSVYKLQLGCQKLLLKGWLNSDVEPSSQDVIHLDVTKQFPFEDCVFDYVYSEHLIEHLEYDDCIKMLYESYRVLKDNGKIRIATPNFFTFNISSTALSKSISFAV